MADSEANELATILSESLAANTPKMGKKKLDDEYTLVFSNEYRTKDDKANALYFYSLNEKGGKMVKILIGGERKWQPSLTLNSCSGPIISKQCSAQRCS